MTEKGTPSETPRCDEIADEIFNDPHIHDGFRWADFARKLERENSRLRDELEKKTAALERIERWIGEFPDAEIEWCGKKQRVSYGVAYGSNGERDYMRAIARSALQPEDKHES